jgi:hypothetical protein
MSKRSRPALRLLDPTCSSAFLFFFVIPLPLLSFLQSDFLMIDVLTGFLTLQIPLPPLLISPNYLLYL